MVMHVVCIVCTVSYVCMYMYVYMCLFCACVVCVRVSTYKLNMYVCAYVCVCVRACVNGSQVSKKF